MSRTHIAAIILTLSVVSAAFLFSKTLGSSGSSPAPFHLANIFSSETPKIDDGSLQISANSSEFAKTYASEKYGFSFQYPEDFRVTSFPEGEENEVIVAEKSGREGFQIFISPFDETAPLTPERIRLDLPEMIIENPETFKLSDSQGEPVEAVAFLRRDESFGKTREVWFSREGNLYQITAPVEFDAELSKIMATFRFN